MKKSLIVLMLCVMSYLLCIPTHAQIAIDANTISPDENSILYCQESDAGIIAEIAMPSSEEDCGYTQGSCDLMYSSESCGNYTFICQPATYNACSSNQMRQAQQQITDLGPLSQDPKAVLIFENVGLSEMEVKTVYEVPNMKPIVNQVRIPPGEARITALKKELREYKKIQSAVVSPKNYQSKEYDWKNRDFKWTVDGVQKTGTIKSKVFVGGLGFKDA